MAKQKIVIEVSDKDAQRVFDALGAAYSVEPTIEGAKAALIHMVASTVGNIERATVDREKEEARSKKREEREAAGLPVEDSGLERAADVAAEVGVELS